MPKFREQGVKYKLLIVFALLSALPFYLFLYVLREKNIYLRGEIGLIICAVLLCFLLGFSILRGMLDRIILLRSMVSDASKEGSSKISSEINGEEEIVEIASYFDKLVENTNRSAEELKGLTEEIGKATKEINEARDNLKKKESQLIALGEAVELISLITDRNQLLREILKRAVRGLAAERGSIMLSDESSQALTIAVSEGLGGDVASNTKVDLGEGVAGWVAAKGEPILVEDISGDSRFSGLRKDRRGYRGGSCISVPLKLRDKVIGVVSVTDKISGESFTEDELHFLITLSKQSAQALEKAQLYERISRFNEELKMEVEHAVGRLREVQEQLVLSEKLAAVGQLASGVAHELRNPLSIINTSRFYLESVNEVVENPDCAKHLDIMKREIERSQKIIQNLLEFSHRSVAKREPISVNNVLKDILKLIDKELSIRGVELEKDFNDSPPIMANLDAMRQIFLNIIMNAIDAMQEGGKLKVSTSQQDGKNVSVKITDTGYGISQNDLRLIFDPFFTTKEPGKGMGLGLSLVHSMASRYGGTIDVESEINKGTTFTVRFPCMDEADAS